jgi:hypothetical protein
LAAALAGLAALPAAAIAQTQGGQLQGVDTLSIAVAPLADGARDCGLTETRIRATAHNFLSANQVTLANQAPVVLLFEAASLDAADVDRCFTGLQALVYRQADYYREEDAVVATGFVLLWSDLRLAASPAEDHAIFVLGQVRDQLQAFLDDRRLDNVVQ